MYHVTLLWPPRYRCTVPIIIGGVTGEGVVTHAQSYCESTPPNNIRDSACSRAGVTAQGALCLSRLPEGGYTWVEFCVNDAALAAYDRLTVRSDGKVFTAHCFHKAPGGAC